MGVDRFGVGDKVTLVHTDYLLALEAAYVHFKHLHDVGALDREKDGPFIEAVEVIREREG